MLCSIQQKNVDIEIKQWYESKENCLRRTILRAIGDSSPVEHASIMCCSHCNEPESVYPPKLSIIESISVPLSKKKRSAVWHVTQDLEAALKERLVEERSKYVRDHPAYMFIGENSVCPDCVISDICRNSRFIKSKQDISCVNGLRPELVDLFFYALLDVLSCSPICRKRRRNN